MALGFQDVLDAAREKSGGLPPPDTESWREGLAILLNDHARADLLTERGLQSVLARYSNCLATRMCVDDFHRRHPEVSKTPIKRPVFILGMPRTGTTLLSNLMASDKANRSILRWEAYNVVPPAAPGALTSDPRCVAEKAGDERILSAAKQVAAAHFEPADGPTECVHLLAQDFRSLMLAVTNTTPTYHDWILFTDMDSAFAHRKRVLQILQINNPGRWVLKMPSDALFIRQVFKTFPDAKVIWTHRDPYKAFASSMGMRGASRSFTEKDAGKDYMRQHFPLQLALHLARPLEFCQERPAAAYHLYYDDLVADPVGQVRKMYDWLGDAWTPEAERAMAHWLTENPQNKHGAHKYALEDWGLTRKDLDPYFADYLRAHPVG
jgi:Sulfotransferase family